MKAKTNWLGWLMVLGLLGIAVLVLVTAWDMRQAVVNTRVAQTAMGATSRAVYTHTPTMVSVSPYACNGVDDLNCRNFSDRRQAQAHLLMCGNEDHLDGDEDGEACEPE